MADTEQIRQQTQSPAPFSTWFGVVLLMFLFGAIVVAVVGPTPRGDTYEQQRAQNREQKLKALRDEDAKALTGYAWIDKTKGSVRIPIERAMQLTVAELANKKPTAAGPIATPATQASPAPAAPAGPGAASPAPSASAQASGTPKPTSVAGQNSEAHGQPAAAIKPPPAPPGTQPNASAPPSPAKSGAAQASPVPVPSAPGSPLPVRGATASPTP